MLRISRLRKKIYRMFVQRLLAFCESKAVSVVSAVVADDEQPLHVGRERALVRFHARVEPWKDEGSSRFEKAQSFLKTWFLDKVGNLHLRDTPSSVEQRLFVLNVGQLPNVTSAAWWKRTQKRAVRREVYRIRKSVAHSSSQLVDLKKKQSKTLAFEAELTHFG